MGEVKKLTVDWLDKVIIEYKRRTGDDLDKMRLPTRQYNELLQDMMNRNSEFCEDGKGIRYKDVEILEEPREYYGIQKGIGKFMETGKVGFHYDLEELPKEPTMSFIKNDTE